MNLKNDTQWGKTEIKSLRSIQIHLMLVFIIALFVGCGDSDAVTDIDYKYIESIEVISPEASSVKLDNFAHLVEIEFYENVNLSAVQLKVNLNEGVKMVSPSSATSTYDLTKDANLKVQVNSIVQTFRIKVSLIKAPFNPSIDKWEKKENYKSLPDYISVFKYKQTVAGKNTQAYIAVADINENAARFKVLGDKKGYKTPSQFYEDNSTPPVVINGGYFWSGTSLGLIISDGKIVSSQEPTYREYNGKSTPYYPTQGVFGMNDAKIFSAHYAYESQGVIYAYPSPAPNKAGEKPQNTPSKNFPENGEEWKLVEAIGAGPLLIKNGEYKNDWEAELFDSFSGIGPTSNQPRSAVGYHPFGYVVFFVCEGRNQTPSTPGLTLEDVANLFLDLGCTDAINLDGGGSSCMLINGEETIVPSDKGKQRSVTNVLVFY